MMRAFWAAAAVLGLSCSGALIAAEAATSQPAAMLDDTFKGEKIDEAAWTRGGAKESLYTVRDGSLRLIATGMTNDAFIATKRQDFDFFKQPMTVVWDLVPDKVLAGPYLAGNRDSRAYASLSIGADSVSETGAQLAIATWPEDSGTQTGPMGRPTGARPATMSNDMPSSQPAAMPASRPANASRTTQDAEAWYYTLSFGSLMPAAPVADMRLSAIPRRIVWTLDAEDWSVTIEGAKFVTGDPQKRSGKHELKADAFVQSGFHLLMMTASYVKAIEPGVKHSGSFVYTDRICVAAGVDAPAYVANGYKDEPVPPTILQDLLGKDYSPDRDAQASRPQYMFGINYAGGTFRKEQSFVPPTEQSLNYFQRKGVMLMRLPIDWEWIQLKVNEPLDEKYVANVRKTMQMMHARGMKVLLDLHSYAHFNGKKLGTPELPIETMVDVWKRLAEAFKDEPGLWGYGLMNEPGCDGDVWRKAVQDCIDGVRKIDPKTMIMVANDYAGTDVVNLTGDLAKWAADHMSFGDPKELKDPASNVQYELHFYPNHTTDGQFNHTYEYDINRPEKLVDPMIGVKRVQPFVEWLHKYGGKGIVGEFSVPANCERDPRWLYALDNVYEYMRKNEVPSTYWAAGTLWSSGRCYVIEPDWREGPNQGKDRPQMQILLKHARLYAGTAGK